MALHEYRAVTVRTITAEDGLAIADIARITRNARQVVSRLYHFSRLGPRSASRAERDERSYDRGVGIPAT